MTVFCIRRAGEPPPPDALAGPGGRRVRLVEEGPLGVWLSDGVASPEIEAIRAHDAVIRKALRTATPLPARFATVFAAEEELRASLRERQEELLSGLRRVEGKVEMGVRVTWEVESTPVAAPIGSGREYLESRRREMESGASLRARAEELLDRVEEWVAPDVVSAVRTLLPEPGVAGAMAHLVHRHAVGVYRSRLEDARSTFPHVHLRVTGPWAPYSFA